jgi:phosphatidylglycerol:prolipoprotein diacylglycerol transferase
VHPILYTIGPFHIGSLRVPAFNIACYGPLIAVGVLVAVFFAIRRAKTVGIAPDFVLDLTFYGVIVGFIGSRIVFILGNLGGFAESPWEYIFSRQGYVFFGGLIFAAIFAIWFVRRRQVEPWQVTDIMAPSIAIGHMFGRVGCFFSGCCYGRICPTGWQSWGVSFPKVTDPATGQLVFSFSYIDQVDHGLIGPDATGSLPILPIQLYEAAANLLIFLYLIWLWRRRRFRGQIFAAYLLSYGTVRFLLEFLRGDYQEPVMLGLLQRGQMSQLMCLTAIAVGIVILWRRWGTPLEVPQTPQADAEPPSNLEQSSETARGRRRRRGR